ncbi:MAG: phosphoadenylylsulfate reductase [Flavobacteriales bacterium CG_4_9_14_0_2_um_filter_35_242]|nr:phosphoadenosine phosphosulfate reductase family protein [Zetaproteobacteria bacterium]NDK17506.1 phosphoadenosine phosphosulfate reductase family protein [Flavobacteriales bacterium]OIO12193.1 MAG: phosphoadenylylsulfate reductase [Flavobacteriaceae bacterium CG1_02_35_72]PIR14141.1 MAG: phosphoadenylylsulfate reductase [Flavobacteriales bacterium CG11_big_fil_rev_8_21_14_0_20_35_7]PIV17788.1 MAG: phosphoadenylylsulfate reductase [Flavobacteriales bacterium CG03_land_8_20_14_0_80_35_15]PIX
MSNIKIDLTKQIAALKLATPLELIQWAIKKAKNPIVTTNFRPYEVALLYACTQVKPDIKVIWCDTGYNTPQTYRHAEDLIKRLNLNIKLYVPQQTSAHRDVVLGIPNIEDSKHKIFTEQVKLEPFKRAMAEHKPDVWFTNLRHGQTAFRDSIDILSYSKDGMLKVSPFYHYTDSKLDTYLQEHQLPNEFKYFDPTKVLENRECGLHI